MSFPKYSLSGYKTMSWDWEGTSELSPETRNRNRDSLLESAVLRLRPVRLETRIDGLTAPSISSPSEAFVAIQMEIDKVGQVNSRFAKEATSALREAAGQAAEPSRLVAAIFPKSVAAGAFVKPVDLSSLDNRDLVSQADMMLKMAKVAVSVAQHYDTAEGAHARALELAGKTSFEDQAKGHFERDSLWVSVLNGAVQKQAQSVAFREPLKFVNACLEGSGSLDKSKVFEAVADPVFQQEDLSLKPGPEFNMASWATRMALNVSPVNKNAVEPTLSFAEGHQRAVVAGFVEAGQSVVESAPLSSGNDIRRAERAASTAMVQAHRSFFDTPGVSDNVRPLLATEDRAFVEASVRKNLLNILSKEQDGPCSGRRSENLNAAKDRLNRLDPFSDRGVETVKDILEAGFVHDEKSVRLATDLLKVSIHQRQVDRNRSEDIAFKTLPASHKPDAAFVSSFVETHVAPLGANMNPAQRIVVADMVRKQDFAQLGNALKRVSSEVTGKTGEQAASFLSAALVADHLAVSQRQNVRSESSTTR